jgi:hypothetical protein
MKKARIVKEVAPASKATSSLFRKRNAIGLAYERSDESAVRRRHFVFERDDEAEIL